MKKSKMCFFFNLRCGATREKGGRVEAFGEVEDEKQPSGREFTLAADTTLQARSFHWKFIKEVKRNPN